MVPRVYWCDCEMIVNLPSVNDGEDEDDEEERLHHGNCLLLDAFGRGLLDVVSWSGLTLF